jgi:hypothetical protein
LSICPLLKHLRNLKMPYRLWLEFILTYCNQLSQLFLFSCSIPCGGRCLEQKFVLKIKYMECWVFSFIVFYRQYFEKFPFPHKSPSYAMPHHLSVNFESIIFNEKKKIRFPFNDIRGNYKFVFIIICSLFMNFYSFNELLEP